MPVLTAPAARLDRRRLLRVAGTLATAALAAPLASRLALGQPRFASYPFALGVASGDPVADGFVLWTRLAPDPLNGGGMPPEAVEVRWEVAERSALPRHRPPRHGAGRTRARPRGPRRRARASSPTAGTSTASSPAARPARSAGPAPFPPLGTPKDRLRFAFASCQHYGQGFFTAYDAMMEDDLDLIVHLGDYIYESDWGPKVRFHLPEPIDLAGYRNHARALQVATRACRRRTPGTRSW